jgi:hypothetical protein
MKPIREMSQAELGAFIHSHLRQLGIDVVLSGGASVAIYSKNIYVSQDLDLVNIRFAKEGAIKAAMQQIGFREEGRHFRHPESETIIEFPPGPLAVGAEPVKSVDELQLPTGTLRIISPTDCVKDRLTSYYHWGDRQALSQAILVAQHCEIDLKEVARWSTAEGKRKEYANIRGSLVGNRSP